jgi:hypothetical protein
MLAHAYPGRHGGDRAISPGSGLIPISLGEVRRLVAHLITTISGRAAWAWSRWRRRHQHRAKTSHYQRRPAVHNDLLLESQAAGRKLRAAAHS